MPIWETRQGSRTPRPAARVVHAPPRARWAPDGCVRRPPRLRRSHPRGRGTLDAPLPLPAHEDYSAHGQAALHYSTMNAGKSTILLQASYNYNDAGWRPTC
jgi:hypothetical protein